MTLGFALSACVFLILTVVLSLSALHAYYGFEHRANRNFRAGAWTSLGLSVILFLTAIWTYAITGG